MGAWVHYCSSSSRNTPMAAQQRCLVNWWCLWTWCCNACAMGGLRRWMQCLPSNDMFYCDAAFEPETKTGGIGAVIFDSVGTCVGWFGFSLDETTCRQETYNNLWVGTLRCGSGLGLLGRQNERWSPSLLWGQWWCEIFFDTWTGYHLHREASNNLCVWYARVPTEANISDFPSRGVNHPMLTGLCDESASALIWFETLKGKLLEGNASWIRGCRNPWPPWKRMCTCSCTWFKLLLWPTCKAWRWSWVYSSSCHGALV